MPKELYLVFAVSYFSVALIMGVAFYKHHGNRKQILACLIWLPILLLPMDCRFLKWIRD